MSGMSQITLIGNLGHDGSLKDVNGTDLVEFSLAVTHKVRGEDLTSWYRCSFWGARAKGVAPYLSKGEKVGVSGKLIPSDYKTKDGDDRTSLDVRVEELTLCGDGERKRRDEPPAAVDGDGGNW